MTPFLGISCIRERNYLNWRYFKNPVKIYRTLVFEIKQELLGFTTLEFSAQPEKNKVLRKLKFRNISKQKIFIANHLSKSRNISG